MKPKKKINSKKPVMKRSPRMEMPDTPMQERMESPMMQQGEVEAPMRGRTNYKGRPC